MCCVIRSDTIKRIEKTPQNEKKAREKQNKQQNKKERKTSKTSLVKLHSSQVTGYKFWDKIPNEQKTIHPRLVLSLKGLCSVLAVLMAVHMCCPWCISVYSDFGKMDSTASIQGEHSDRKSTLKLNSSYYIAPIAQ